jgi:hypothetical protein
MFILATEGTTLPPAATGGVALALSLGLLVAWTLYFYR